MKKLKKVGLLAIICTFLLTLTGCTNNVEGTLEELMTKVYSNVAEEERPKALTNMEVNSENIE